MEVSIASKAEEPANTCSTPSWRTVIADKPCLCSHAIATCCDSLFLSTGLPSITLPLPGHNMHLVELVTVLVLLVIIVHRPSAYFSMSHLLGLLFLVLSVISFIHVPEFAGDSSIYAADK